MLLIVKVRGNDITVNRLLDENDPGGRQDTACTMVIGRTVGSLDDAIRVLKDNWPKCRLEIHQITEVDPDPTYDHANHMLSTRERLVMQKSPELNYVLTNMLGDPADAMKRLLALELQGIIQIVREVDEVLVFRVPDIKFA